nr:PBSX family phage terminase large subunit [Pseudoflavonifractor phocaeensis]
MVFSPKQRKVLTWWRSSSPERERQAIICDGAVRSGKTLCTGLSFFCWAMSAFHRKNFALCGKTIVSVRRNLLEELLPLLENMGFRCEHKVSRNILKVRLGGHSNTFYLFGGKDEGSAALIQGITLAGALLDEVALMPRSFVEQTVARCSVTGSKLWFSCNPESPAHWFYREWILKAEEKKALRLRFTMADNPGLSQEVLERYRTMFEGTFYRRFVLGEWVAAEGRVYDFFDDSYTEYLKDLLRPLGVCDLNAPFNAGELEGAGEALDGVEGALEELLRESSLATAESWGLERMARLFVRRPAAGTPRALGAALAALLRIGGDSFTLEAINDTIAGCGIEASVEELGVGIVEVSFPGVAGVPENFEQIKRIVEDILPPHLDIQYFFWFLTWEGLERKFSCWQDIEDQKLSWKELEAMVYGSGPKKPG